MSNHFHMLVDTSSQLAKLPLGVTPNRQNYTGYSKFMQLIKGGSAFIINGILDRRGMSLWEPESYDHLVRNELELHNIIRYIVLNPVKAGLVKYWQDFPFSYIHPDFLGIAPPPPVK